MSDDDLVAEIRAILAACPFHGEGYRKVRARLAHRGRAVSGKRGLRLVRTHGLLAPRPQRLADLGIVMFSRRTAHLAKSRFGHEGAARTARGGQSRT